ncbi:ABC transporter substrate-binding protein [Paenibacillus chungangensis]|uniref:ABC transporter substrate-binding protein n=1 Tax=Paenibacillus chungangensis TaxID=696535 RepID=A0ABW3HV22_9BACL
MKTRKPWLKGTAGTIMLALLLSACSSGNAVNEPAGNGQNSDGNAGEQQSSNFNAEGYPIVNEKVTLKLAAFQSPSGKHMNDYLFYKEAEEKTNVRIEWELNPGGSAWQEKKNLLFASGELPEGFYGHGILNEATDVVKYGSQGVLIPLEELIELHAPNIKALFDARPDYRKALTAPDGHIYALPTINEVYAVSKPALFINKKWLDAVNMPLPETTDEFYQALKAFKEQDANGNGKADEIPLTFRAEDWNSDLASFFGSFGRVDRRNHIVVEEDNVIYTAAQPEYKQAIEYFHTLFKDGIADPESFTQDRKVFSAKISQNDQVGAFIAWNYNSVGLPEDNDFVPLAPLKGPEGHQQWAGFMPGILFKGSFSLTSAAEQPEVAIRWIDYMYDPEVSMQAVHGVIGPNLEEQADGTYRVIPVPEGKTSDEFKEVPKTAMSVWAQTKEMQEKIVSENQQKLPKTELDALYEPYLVYNEFPKAYFTAEEDSELSRYMTDIGTYTDKMYASWMLNGGIDKDWDGYLKKLEDMGLSKLIGVYQQAYDRYQAGE